MKVPSVSARLLCLAIAAPLTLSSCASFVRPATTLTPRSESVCDQAPPAPIPPVPDTHPALEAMMRALMGLYRDEIIKDNSERTCRAGVRAENLEAAKRAR